MLLSTLAVSLSLIDDDIMHGSLSAGFIQIKRLIKGYKVINSTFLFFLSFFIHKGQEKTSSNYKPVWEKVRLFNSCIYTPIHMVYTSKINKENKEY